MKAAARALAHEILKMTPAIWSGARETRGGQNPSERNREASSEPAVRLLLVLGLAPLAEFDREQGTQIRADRAKDLERDGLAEHEIHGLQIVVQEGRTATERLRHDAVAH